MIKKYLGYLLIFASIFVAFYRGKRQGELDCIDFNVLPIIANSITIIVCVLLVVIGAYLTKHNTIKN